MCAKPGNCGKYTANDISNRVGFTRPSVVRKLKKAKHLSPPMRLETGSGFEMRYCGEHLRHIAKLEVDRLPVSKRRSSPRFPEEGPEQPGK
jgi:hypothetical protein